MTQLNRADQGVRAAEVFVECTEKTPVRDFEFSARGDSPASQMRKRLPKEKLQVSGSKAGGLAYTE